MQRDFCLGSQWLYYKIYTGTKTADHVLVEKLNPVISYLEGKKKIQKWFFIRYKDPEEHIRLRFLLDDIDNLAIIIHKFHLVFKELMDENIIWKIQTDTYQREIERYGKETMYYSEFLFWKDSRMILKYLSLQTSFLEKETPLFCSFLMIDSFLNSFKLSNLEKLTLINDLQITFKKEFEIDKIQKKKMDIKYRSLLPELKQFLEATNQSVFPEIFYIVSEKSNQIKETALKIIDKIEIPLNDFLSSHIHMMINRQYTSKQRMYELVIYDHLHRYYKTLNYN
jgi:thiopeptide-type bacteriocin biosynthesis protein